MAKKVTKGAPDGAPSTPKPKGRLARALSRGLDDIGASKGDILKELTLVSESGGSHKLENGLLSRKAILTCHCSHSIQLRVSGGETRCFDREGEVADTWKRLLAERLSHEDK